MARGFTFVAVARSSSAADVVLPSGPSHEHRERDQWTTWSREAERPGARLTDPRRRVRSAARAGDPWVHVARSRASRGRAEVDGVSQVAVASRHAGSRPGRAPREDGRASEHGQPAGRSARLGEAPDGDTQRRSPGPGAPRPRRRRRRRASPRRVGGARTRGARTSTPCSSEPLRVASYGPTSTSTPSSTWCSARR